MLTSGQQILGYTLTASLGANRPGRSVFAALDPSGDRVVIKFAAHPDGGLTREAELLGGFAGIPVVRPVAFGTLLPQQLQFLVLTAVGPSLAAVLTSLPGRSLAPEVALLVALETARSVAALHERGWVHRDLKPGNLLLSANGGVVLADLELAHRPDEAATALDLAGTLPFLAPELWAEGGAAFRPASDVWALGVVLYICLAGRYPFSGTAPHELMRTIMAGEMNPLPSSVPPAVAQLVNRLLSSRERRPTNGTAAARAIAEVAALFPPVDPTVLAELVRSCPLYADLCGPPTMASLPELRLRDVPPADAYVEVRSTLAMPRPDTLVEPGTFLPTATGTPPLRRKAAARWYRRMNPHRSFAVALLFSGSEIRIVAAHGMAIAIGTGEIAIDPADPVVEVEPCFPGCIVSPPRPRVDLTPATQVARFWVTPLAEGELNDACIHIYHRGRLVETLPTPTRVVKRTWAKVCLLAGLAWPALQFVAARAGWSPMDEVAAGFPLVGKLFASVGAAAGSLVVGMVLVGVGLVFYRMTRPIESNQDEVPLLA